MSEADSGNFRMAEANQQGLNQPLASPDTSGIEEKKSNTATSAATGVTAKRESEEVVVVQCTGKGKGTVSFSGAHMDMEVPRTLVQYMLAKKPLYLEHLNGMDIDSLILDGIVKHLITSEPDEFRAALVDFGRYLATAFTFGGEVRSYKFAHDIHHAALDGICAPFANGRPLPLCSMPVSGQPPTVNTRTPSLASSGPGVSSIEKSGPNASANGTMVKGASSVYLQVPRNVDDFTPTGLMLCKDSADVMKHQQAKETHDAAHQLSVILSSFVDTYFVLAHKDAVELRAFVATLDFHHYCELLKTLNIGAKVKEGRRYRVDSVLQAFMIGKTGVTQPTSEAVTVLLYAVRRAGQLAVSQPPLYRLDAEKLLGGALLYACLQSVGISTSDGWERINEALNSADIFPKQLALYSTKAASTATKANQPPASTKAQPSKTQPQPKHQPKHQGADDDIEVVVE